MEIENDLQRLYSDGISLLVGLFVSSKTPWNEEKCWSRASTCLVFECLFLSLFSGDFQLVWDLVPQTLGFSMVFFLPWKKPKHPWIPKCRYTSLPKRRGSYPTWIQKILFLTPKTSGTCEFPGGVHPRKTQKCGMRNMIFLFNRMIFRFQPLKFQGVQRVEHLILGRTFPVGRRLPPREWNPGKTHLRQFGKAQTIAILRAPFDPAPESRSDNSTFAKRCP